MTSNIGEATAECAVSSSHRDVSADDNADDVEDDNGDFATRRERKESRSTETENQSDQMDI